MKTTTPPTGFSILKVYCSLFGHNYQISKEVTNHIKEYTCSHCKNEVTTNVRGRLESMTPKLKEINLVLQKVHAKRQERIANRLIFKVAS